MNRGSTVFLQVVIVLIALGTLVLMLWEPQVEGRNAHATQYEIYLKDPFLAYAYLASLPFFTALYQIFRVLGYADRGKVFSRSAVRALGTTKYCAMALIGFVAGAELFILLSTSDDRAGGVAIGILIAFVSVIIATAAAVFEKHLQVAVEMKAEQDLTV